MYDIGPLANLYCSVICDNATGSFKKLAKNFLNNTMQSDGFMFLLYLKDLQLLQRDLLTLTMLSGEVDGLKHESRVCSRETSSFIELKPDTDILLKKTKTSIAQTLPVPMNKTS